MAFGKGTKVKTSGGTTGTVAGEIRHPVTRKTTGVVVQPSGGGEPVVTTPKNVTPVTEG